MKDKNKVFFGEAGITSTSANHIANVAKEYVQNLQNENDAIGFLDCRVSLMTSPQDAKTITYGVKADILEKIPGNLHHITEANSLIAWLREAIKAKEAEMEAVTKLAFDDYLKAENIDKLERPERENYGFVEFDDILATLTIKEREEYYRLETKCAVTGKFIHPDGSFSRARKELQKIMLQPVTVLGDGQNAMVYEYTASMEQKAVEDLFFSLQNEHRNTQASLNAIKYKVQQKVDELNQKANNSLSADTAEYNNACKKLNIDYNAYKEKNRAELSKLKIIIPNELETVFEIMNKIGK
jgi:Skp family chaperone for outer membrane proteins